MRMNMTMSMRFSSNLRRVLTRRHAEHRDARAATVAAYSVDVTSSGSNELFRLIEYVTVYVRDSS